jgi:hypothetical protein
MRLQIITSVFLVARTSSSFDLGCGLSLPKYSDQIQATAMMPKTAAPIATYDAMSKIKVPVSFTVKHAFQQQ